MPDSTTLAHRPIWMFGLPDTDPSGTATDLARHGYSAVVLSPLAEQVQIARDAGLATYACFRTFEVDPSSDDDLLVESALGGRHSWFSSGCPNAPELRERHLEQVGKLLASTLWDGVFLDGIRFASPHAGPDAFFSCFCRRCQSVAERLGYDFDRMRRHVGALQRFARGERTWSLSSAAPIDVVRLLVQSPGIGDWLRFRADCIAEHVAAVRQVVTATPGKLLGAYLFTPSLAPLVGQDYRRLSPYLDVVSPMIYRQGDGDAVLASELESSAGMLVAAGLSESLARAFVANVVGMTPVEPEASSTPLANSIGPSHIGAELRWAARELGGYDKLMPIVWFDDPRLGDVLGECQDAAGLSLFILTDATRARSREAADGWRSLHPRRID